MRYPLRSFLEQLPSPDKQYVSESSRLHSIETASATPGGIHATNQITALETVRSPASVGKTSNYFAGPNEARS